MAMSNPPKEYTIFISHFAELVDTLNPQHVLHYLTSENTISVDDSQRVLAAVTMKDKARKLLELLAGPIKAGHIRGLWALVEAMEKHGVGAEKELAVVIKDDFTKCENPPVQGISEYTPIGLPRSKKESFMKLLVGLSDYLDDVEGSFVKRFKLSLKFYSVTDRGVKVVKEVYESTHNIPDILENLVNHEYVTVDNVDLLEAVIKNCMADDKRYIQLYQHTSSVIEEYKKSVVLCDTQYEVQRISIASLPVNLQYVIVSTSYPAMTLRHKDVEEVGDAISSVLSLPKLYFHFCGFDGDLVTTFCWVLHGTDCLKGYKLTVPDYDHYHWLRHLGVLSITVTNDSDCQVIDLQLVNYTGCLLLPKNRDTSEWTAKFFCVPAGYEKIIKDQTHQSFYLDHEMFTIPIGFKSFASGDDHKLSIRLFAQDLGQYGWTVNTYNEQFAIDKYVVDGVVAMDMPELLPHIPIEVWTTGIHHSVRFPGCKVEIEGSCYNQSFMLLSTPALEETQDIQSELVSSGGTDYLWTSDSNVYTQYHLVEDYTATIQQ